MNKTQIKVATIDLYNNEPNEGIRCIGEIVNESAKENTNVDLKYKRFETRYKDDLPDLGSITMRIAFAFENKRVDNFLIKDLHI